MAIRSYTSRKKKLLKDFDKSTAYIGQSLVSRYGIEQGNNLIRESHQEYAALIPQTPYIGETTHSLIFFMPTGRYLALYRVLKRHGHSVEEAGELVYKIVEASVMAISGFMRRTIEYLWFSPWFLRRLQRLSLESQKRTYPGGYVFDYVEGIGQDFDYGIDYIECASHKFLISQGVVELCPYICAVDKVVSENLGWGLSRTMTIAEGHGKCDFRFTKGGRTYVPIPKSLMQIVHGED